MAVLPSFLIFFDIEVSEAYLQSSVQRSFIGLSEVTSSPTFDYDYILLGAIPAASGSAAYLVSLWY